MAKIIDIKSALKKARPTPNRQGVTGAQLDSGEPRQFQASSTNNRPCKLLLESLKSFADLVDKQVTDIGKI